MSPTGGVAIRPASVEPVSLAAVAHAAGAPTPEKAVIAGVTLRADHVQPGDLFAALPGANTHGARFAGKAAEQGAAAVLTDAAGAELASGTGLPLMVVADPRGVLGDVAAFVYGHPARALTLIGVTGTQGKTTTTQLAAAGLAGSGRRTGVVGTMGTWIAGERLMTALTTPEAPDLHALFAVMRERGVDVCVMEVSSHALVLGRVDGVTYDVAVFTNFGRDHLDFHGDMASYLAAKASLFTPARARRALLNADDPVVAGLAADLRIPVATFSASGRPADWRAERAAVDPEGARFTLLGPQGLKAPVETRLTGGFNVANTLAALAAIGEAGGDAVAAADGIAQVATVPGRLERIEAGQSFTVVVDYAHKPDAVTAVLTTLRPVTAGRLIIVLGAGGDRDRGKRPLMGETAAALADVVVVTDDNPRSEAPEEIRREILAGARRQGAAEVREIGDRRAAIAWAVSAAQPGDTVLIAGKGHESGQEVAGEVLPFDDREVARALITAQTEGAR